MLAIFVVITLLLLACAIVASLKWRPAARTAPRVPLKSDFPVGTIFLIKEFDVPLAKIPSEKYSSYVNWYGGIPRSYDAGGLKIDNNWPAESFEAWCNLVEISISINSA